MHKYDWAVNQTKVDQSVLALTNRKAYKPETEITEASIKEEYIRRGGLLTEDSPFEEVELQPVVVPVKKNKILKRK